MTRPVVLLLHGLNGNHTAYNPYVEPFGQAGFDVILPDLRGHGKSCSALTRETVTLERYAQDIEEICAVEGVHRVSLLAHCFGANVAVVVAGRKRLSVDRLMLVAPYLYTKKNADRISVRRLLVSPLLNFLAQLPFLVPDPRKKIRYADHTYHQHWPLIYFAFYDLMTNRLWVLPLGIRAVHEGVSLFEQSIQGLPRIPALLVAGGHDLVMPPKYVQVLADKLAPHCDVIFERLPRVGHVLPVQRSKWVINRFLQFVGKSES